jgi:hypothetical protein
MPNTNISMCITACGRNDLMEQSLKSFYAVVDQEPQEVLIYEDSDGARPEFLNNEIWRCRNVRWISGKTRMGQCWACARLIQEAKHDYVFWSEEDWLWHNQISPFMRESKAILDAHCAVVQVSLRGPSGWHPLVKAGALTIAEPYWRGCWGGWSWNPGLRRRETLVRILPQVLASVGLKGLEHEQKLSKSLLDQGYRIADLGRPIVTHIGGNRSRSVEELPPLPKILVAVPTCFKLDYEGKWEHKGNPEYGKDMHVSGQNEQTQACRETWVKDFAPFRNVDVRFFYGKPPEGHPREPFADEVFLECPDGYGNLIDKSVGVCKWAADRGYEYLYKCDTDTWVFAEKLLVEMMENSFDYAGYLHANVCSGGPGYFLSRHAIGIIAAHGSTWRHPYAEDVHVSRVLAEHGIMPVMLQNHRPGFSAHFFFGDGISFDAAKVTEEIVTMHAVFPSQMRQMWKLKQRLLEPVAA